MSWFVQGSQNVPVSHRSSASRDDFLGWIDDFFKTWDFPHSSISPSSRLGEEWGNHDRWSPPINISETDKAYLVEAELPGVKKGEFGVEVHNGVLIIKGAKKSFFEDKKDQYYRMERSHGQFQRSIRLPLDADESHVSAKLENGILQIEVQKSADVAKERKTISVQ